jgi:hypothetical protein
VLVAGIHPKGNQDGFPIKNVVNDGEGEGLSINLVGNEEEEKIPVGTGITEGGFVLSIQHVRHSSDTARKI